MCASAGSTAAGNKAIAYLRAHAGQFVASETLAAEIGTTCVGDAIKATADAVEVESRVPGRRRNIGSRSNQPIQRSLISPEPRMYMRGFFLDS